MQQPVERAMATGGDSGGNSIRNGTCMAMHGQVELYRDPCNAHLSPMKLLHCWVHGHPAVPPRAGGSGPGPGPDSGVAVTRRINKTKQG